MTLVALTFVLAAADVSMPPLVPAPAQASDSPPPLIPARPVVVVAPAPREQRRLFELAIPGAVLALGSWVAGMVMFFDSIDCRGSWLSNCYSASGWLFLPQVGPWLALTDPSTHNGYLVQTLALGVTQLAGLIAMITGFAFTVPVDIAPTLDGVAVSGRF